MFGFGKKKGPTLGLDINSDILSLVELKETKTGIELTRYLNRPTPPNVLHEGLVTAPDAVGALLKEMLEEARLSKVEPAFNVVVPGQSVVIRLMPVPVGMPDAELADVVSQEAVNHIPFSMSDANLDWSIMRATERTDPDGVRRVDVIIAAVQKTVVDSYWRMAEVASATIGKIDVSSLATIRALSYAGYLIHPEELKLVVDIRYDATDISVVRSGMPLFSRSILIGLDTLAEAISRSLSIGHDQAIKMMPEIPLQGMTEVDERIGQASQIARTIYGDVLDEVTRSLEFYRSQVGEVSVGQVLLCGHGAAIPQLDQFVSGRLNIPAIPADPLRDTIYDANAIPESRRPGLIMPVGAVVDPELNPVSTVELDLNKEGPSVEMLEGFDERSTVRVVQPGGDETPWFRPVLAFGIGLFAFMLILFAYINRWEVPRVDRESLELARDIDNARKELTQLNELKQENELLQKKKAVLKSIVKSRKPWASVMKAIAENTPKDAQIAKVEVEGSKVTVEGFASDFTQVSYLSVNLAGTPLFRNATVVYARRELAEDPRQIRFAVRADLAAGITSRPARTTEKNQQARAGGRKASS